MQREKAKGEGVKAKGAANELAQLEARDPTDLNRKIITAEAALRAAKKAGGVEAPGELWWCERELLEARKYKPKSAGGIAKANSGSSGGGAAASPAGK